MKKLSQSSAWLFIAVIILASGLLAACGSPVYGGDRTPMGAPESSPERGEDALPAEDKGGPVYYPREDMTYPSALIGRALQDLAERLDASLDSLEIVSVEAVTWPDSSLGGARDGALQVLTPGFRIVVTLDGMQYAYHTGLTEEDVAFYGPATNPDPPREASESSPEPGADGLPTEDTREPLYYPRDDMTYPSALIERALQDLAERLDASLDSLEIVSVEAVTWPDSSLGGARDGALQVLTPGFRIVVTLDGMQYAYHTGLTQEDVAFYGLATSPNQSP